MHSEILINEFFPDPIGPDRGWEWIEIVNISEKTINLSNWEIEVGGVRYNRAFKFPENSYIEPGQYFLICEEYVNNCHFYTNLLAMQNGIGKTDGVRILDEEGNLVDLVLYSRPNRNELKNIHRDIEVDENIIEMPEEGYSFARKNFSNSGYSIQDFFTTSNPTPGKPNFFPNKIIISEIALEYIEFYTTQVPPDINNWYFKENKNSTERFFLKNIHKNNFFFLDNPKGLKSIYLYSPQDQLIDFFETEHISPNFSYCRINNQFNDDFLFCEKTKGEMNIKKEWETFSLIEVLQIGKEDYYIIEGCIIYEHGNYKIISDETAALSVKCDHCLKKDCYLGEFYDSKNFHIFNENLSKEIKIDLVNKNNYSNLIDKVVFLNAKKSQSINNYTYLKTEIGIVKTKGAYSSEKEYTLQGILRKQDNELFYLEHAIVLEQKIKSDNLQLEQTGDPILFLAFFFILPFIISQIFVRLSNINFKRKFL